MKLSVLCLLSVLCCACTAQQPDIPPYLPPPTPAASVNVKRVATTPNGCQIEITISNTTEVAWDVATIHIAFRNNSSVVIADHLWSPEVYTEPGRGILVRDIVQGISCKEIAAVSLLYFGYYPQNQGQIQVEQSSIPTSLQ
jgi:hypothetical protein